MTSTWGERQVLVEDLCGLFTANRVTGVYDDGSERELAALAYNTAGQQVSQ